MLAGACTRPNEVGFGGTERACEVWSKKDCDKQLAEALADLKADWDNWKERKMRQSAMENRVQGQGLLDACMEIFKSGSDESKYV